MPQKHVNRGMLTGLLTGLLLVYGCEQARTEKKVAPFSGPIETIANVEMLYSEAARLKVKMTTPQQLRYLNDDRKYPKQVKIVFYDVNGQPTTTLRSDSGRYDKVKDLYTVMGNVVVINTLKQEKLLTPTLNWKPSTKKVYTDQRVTIISQLTGEKLYGIGMDATQDFSQYSIRKPTGIFNVGGGL